MSELFLPETEEERAKIAAITRIHVRRKEGGKYVYAHTSFEPEAITSMEGVFDLFGGGDYLIEGRDENGVFCKNARFQLAGKPKPLAPEPEPAPAAALVAAAAPALSEGSMMMQLMMAQMNQTTTLLTTILSRGDSSSQNLLERSRQLEDRARLEHTQFLQTILERSATQVAALPAGGNKESFLEGIEFAQGLMEQINQKNGSGGEGENPADLLSTFKSVVEGLGALANTNKGGATPPPANGAT
jgi:hypothetical protein